MTFHLSMQRERNYLIHTQKNPFLSAASPCSDQRHKIMAFEFALQPLFFYKEIAIIFGLYGGTLLVAAELTPFIPWEQLSVPWHCENHPYAWRN